MERLQHEPPLRQARMRHYQPFFSDTCSAMEQEIQVDPSRPPVGRTDAAEYCRFNVEQSLQQLMGSAFRVEPKYSVVEQRLVGNADGRGLIKWRQPGNLAIRKPPYFCYCAQQVQFAISHVGAEGYVRIRLHRRIKS